MAISPPGCLGASVAKAAGRAGFLGGVSLEFASAGGAPGILDELVRSGTPFAVVVDQLSEETVAAIEPFIGRGLSCVVLACRSGTPIGGLTRLKDRGVEVLIRVTCLEDALSAQACGADGIIVKGNEAGGYVGEETTFILLQRVLPKVDLPVYAQGGIGVHTAAACRVAGAAGVVMDWQFALCRESDCSEEVRTRIMRMDGGETAVLGQNSIYRYRTYYRVGDRAFDALYELQGRLGVDGNSSDAVLREWRQAVEARIVAPAGAERLHLIGQDAAYAKPYAAEFKSVAAVCCAVRDAAQRDARLAAKHRALEPGGSLAASHGTRYPIVQGPMTRVSDTAEFADKVAAGGGLPFLALALLRGPQVDTLLEATKAKLGDRPWGVGILGFVPKELREEQLAEVRKHPPPFAIIAGGRPDQARSLEQDGIKTYLHVPSPGLLSMFLTDGARRVIFEGRECGGHVGPRTSFVLWESMVRTMLEHLKGSKDPADSYHVLFAGGIHDGLSAAMVSAIAAPLSERGVRVGVLLGTSYLFTKEAVGGGAIGRAFQDEAVACEHTVLLETGVGHATRCADTPFGQYFSDEKKRLSKENKSKDELRDTLEALNLGRLRIASKGIVRSDDEASADVGRRYVQVDEDAQHREGMYMIGQVAALRDRVVTIEALHEDVSAGSVERLRPFLPVGVAGGSGHPSDIAIVGMASMFAKADDIHAYWSNILNKVVGLGEIPDERFDADLYFDANRQARDKIYSRWGGFLNDQKFDPMRYGMVPNSVPSVEPMQLLVLEAVRQALADAGYADRPFDRAHTAVVLGAGGGVADLGLGYGVRSLLPHYLTKAGATKEDAAELIDRLNGELPEWTEDSFAGLLINVVAGRVANRFDLGGTNFAVDAACASSLAAVRLAVNELETGAANMAIVGGADTMQGPFAYLCFSKTQALSPTGQSRTLDEAGDGIVIAEGIAFAVLKRLSDAERDGDRIYAVIKGVGASSDGRDKGMTAPRPEGQMRALHRAYEKAGLSPATVDLVEAHGTGTVVGDRSEVQSLTHVFSEAGAATQRTALGSVKSMIGHTKCTAGVAGLLKMALSLHHKVLPPTAGVTKPNPKANFGQSPFYVNSETRPWVARPDGTPRRASVSAFGFGGTNFHAVLEEYAPAEGPAASALPVRDWPAELFVWRKESAESLTTSLDELLAAFEQGACPAFRDLAAAVSRDGAGATGDCVLAIVADSIDDLKDKLQAAATHLQRGTDDLQDPKGVYFTAGPVGKNGRVAFLFPGQGSQRVNMVRDLCVALPLMRRVFEQADAALGDRWARPLSHFVFPKPAFTDEDRANDEEALTRTNVAQPALGAADVAMFRLLQQLGIHPDVAAGHSYGELAALCAAGILSFEDLIRASEARGRFMLEAASDGAGTMAAVSADEATVAAVIGPIEGVWIANLNAPTQTVITGTEAGVGAALATLKQQKISGRRIKVSCAFHSPLVASASAKLHGFLTGLALHQPRFTVYSNTTAGPHEPEADAIRTRLSEHLVNPVRFTDELTAMYEDGARVFIECGPGTVLSGLARKTLADEPVATIAMEQSGRHGLTQLCHSLAQIAVAGVRFDATPLYEGRIDKDLDVARLAVDATPEPVSPTTWLVNGSRAIPYAKRNEPKRKPQPTAPRSGDGLAPWQADPAPVRRAASTPAQVQADHGPLNGQAPAPSLQPSAAYPAASPQAPVPQAAPPAGADSVMQAYHDMMARFLEAQQNIMLGYLGQTPQAVPSAMSQMPATVPAVVPVVTPQPVVAPLDAAPTPAPVPVASGATATPIDTTLHSAAEEAVPAAYHTPATDSGWTFDRLKTHLVSVVSDKTGYPDDMLDIDLDLEADLGIDSIKRIEILGTLQSDSILQGDSADGDMEALSKLKTLRALIDWLEAHTNGAAVPASAAVEAPRAAAAPAPTMAVQTTAASSPVPRMLVRAFACPITSSQQDLPGGGYIITNDGGGVAEALATRLRDLGKPVEIVTFGPGDDGNGNAGTVHLTDPNVVQSYMGQVRPNFGRVAGVLHLMPLGAEKSTDWSALERLPARLHAELHTLFNLVQSSEEDLRRGGGRLLTATRLGGAYAFDGASSEFWPGGASVCGLVKSVAREWSDVVCRAVDFAQDAGAEDIADSLLQELLTDGGPIEVGYRDVTRLALRPIGAELATRAAGIALTNESVVVLTGGARGITAEVATEMAKRFACRLVLIGRTSEPQGNETADTAELNEPRDLKAALMGRLKASGTAPTPKQVEAAYRKLLGEREIRGNLATMRAAGSEVIYRAADVSDHAAIGAILDEAYDRFGRVDGVVHGAGVIEDKLIRDKTGESFDRVVTPKVQGALALVKAIRPETLQFMTFFSSVSARYGNRGQCDYAAANEVLNKLAVWLNARWQARVTSLNWGPWESSGGMVSAELAKRFAEAGVHVIDRPAGRAACVDELLFGDKTDVEVVFGGPLDGVIEAGASSVDTANSGQAEAMPLLGTQSEMIANGSGHAVVNRVFGPRHDVYLWDHQLEGVPVMPMAMMMEFLSEVGASVRPDLEVARVRDLRVLRGITFDSGPSVVRVETTGVADTPNGCEVKLRAGCVSDKPDLRYMATVELVHGNDSSPRPGKLVLEHPKPLPISLDEAYATWLFHGRLFAGIERVEAVGDNGLHAMLRPSNVGECFAGGAPGTWLIDPVLVDSALQMVILWARTYRDMTPLPASVTCYHRFGPPPTGRVWCEVAVRSEHHNPAIYADLMFYDESGTPFGWLENMQGTCSKALNRLGTARARGAEVST